MVVFEPPAIQGMGNFGGFQFELQDLGRNTLADLDRVAHQIVGASRQSKKLVGLYTSYTANDPQLLITIDREKAKAIGVSLSQISSRLASSWDRRMSTISTTTTGRTVFMCRRISLRV